jgi:small subunit ribosomal protein S2
MAMPTFTMRQLLEAGVHFGHRTRRWNPKMAPYLFGVRNKVHIIDLQQTVPMLYQAMGVIREVVASGGRVLFVGTKRQASDLVADHAKRCGQYYVNHRWLGGMLTNWKTISLSIKRLRDMDGQLTDDDIGHTKKELLRLTRQRDKLERALGGIKEMGGLPDILFVIDTNKEAIAVREAIKLDIPIVAVIDSNSDPEEITHPIPGNDDSLRAIRLYCELISGAVLDGLQEELMTGAADAGESEEAPEERLPETVEQGAEEMVAGQAAAPEVPPEADPAAVGDDARQQAEAGAKPFEPGAEVKPFEAEAEVKPPEAEAGAKPSEAGAEVKPPEAEAGAKPSEAEAEVKPSEPEAEKPSAPEPPVAETEKVPDKAEKKPAAKRATAASGPRKASAAKAGKRTAGDDQMADVAVEEAGGTDEKPGGADEEPTS